MEAVTMGSKAELTLTKTKPEPNTGELVQPPTMRDSPAHEALSLSDPSLYINRELSLLAFQRRVLEEARDPSNPLLERVKFLSIVGSNLDEFFMIRVAGLMRQVEAGTVEPTADGMTPAEQIEAIRADVANLLGAAHKCLRRELLPALEKAGIKIREYRQLTSAQRARAEKHFSETVFPILTPLAFDPGRPFPHISNLSLNLAVLIRDGEGQQHFARVKIPATLPQLVSVDVPSRASKKEAPVRQQTFVWL
jgi:polyphosphate kinase